MFDGEVFDGEVFDGEDAEGEMLRFHLVTEVAELAAMRGAWEDLMGRSDMDEPMLGPDWMLAWWRVFGAQGRSLRAALFFDGPRLVGLAPLLERRCRHRSGIPFRRLELLASGEDQADEICSCNLGVIAERGAEADVAHALAGALTGAALGAWDELVLPAMRTDGALPVILARALRQHGIDARIEVTDASPYIPLPSSWEAYLRALSASRRYLVRRSMRDLEAWAGGALTLERARTRAELAGAREILLRLHAERWSADGRAGVFASPRFSAFHDEVMPAMLERGALELAWLSARGEPVAALYNLVWNNKVYFYQCGRRVDLPKGLRPGIVVHAYAIRAAIEAGRREYDFLDSPCQYKLALSLSARPLVELRAARPSVNDSARRAAELAAHELRVMKRRVLATWRAAARSLRRDPADPPAPPREEPATAAADGASPRPAARERAASS
ncbi:GNAT family N-acetyltransferase [Sorangium cellulosum]|uniref:GNAT family N-acetyltransferase n=1 Tax=Sorangium cellulosum TaxID=56 RepID=UPI0004265E07|nr:GNAT family N-acetyltransferase [Sorangium cellulosum]